MDEKKRKIRRAENLLLCLLVFLLVFVPAVWFSSGFVRALMAVLAVFTLAVGGIIAWRREQREGISVDQNHS